MNELIMGLAGVVRDWIERGEKRRAAKYQMWSDAIIDFHHLHMAKIARAEGDDGLARVHLNLIKRPPR